MSYFNQYQISNLQKVLACFLLGTLLAAQSRLSIIFYGSYIIDWLVSGMLLVISYVVAQKYINPRSSVLILVDVLFVLIVATGDQIEFALYSFTESVSIVSYALLIISTINVASYKPENESLNIFSWLLPILALIIGTIAGYYIENRIFIWGLVLIYVIFRLINKPGYITFLYKPPYLAALVILIVFYLKLEPLTIYDSQKKFHDKVVFSHTTPYQKLDVTSWKGHHWFYQNNINQFSSIDEWLYYEPLVHPALLMTRDPKNILVIGGENGLISREIIKYFPDVEINILPIDTGYLNIARSNALFTKMNQGSLDKPTVSVLQNKVLNFVSNAFNQYDILIIDIPDPVDLELNQYYTKEFYQICWQALKPTGIIVTQAGSPYYATRAFHSINKTMISAGYSTVPYHNQILTLGEWGWVLGVKNISQEQLESNMRNLEFSHVNTKWINKEAMQMMMSFGKPQDAIHDIAVNTIKNPVVHKYYTTGTWSF